MKERQEKILKETVKYYIQTCEPVSSKVLRDKCALNVGASTVRHELNQLEKEGFLTHVHTSSGRIPTDKGYRKYVNELKRQDTSPKQVKLASIRGLINPLESNIEKILTNVSKVMGTLMDYSMVIVTPDVYQELLKRVHLVLLDLEVFLIVIVIVSF